MPKATSSKNSPRHYQRLKALIPACVLAIAGCGSANESSSALVQEEAAEPTRGLNAKRLEATLQRAAELPNLRSLIVMRGGKELVAERFNGGPDLNATVNIKSASKSVISAMVGIAIERGVLEGTDQPVLSELAGYAPENYDPRLQQVTVGNLLSMQAGLQRTSGDNYGRWVSSPNWVRYALSQPFVEEPGGAMLYSTGSTHLLSAMLTEASGQTTWALAQQWLAEPLDIQIPQWERDPQGIYLGGNQMAMSPRGMARFGELYRLGGTIDGNRVVSERWIEESWTPATTSPWSGQSYGYGWFIAEAGEHPVYYSWGYGGQMIYIVPSLALTVVMTSGTDISRGSGHIDALWSLLEDGIIPSAEIGT